MQVKNYFSQFFLKKTKILLKSTKNLQKIFRLKGIPFRRLTQAPKKLLALPALSKMKKKEYQRIGIDENDIKKFVKIFSKKKDIGCIIALSVIAAVVLGILIFLVSNFGFKIGFLIFILLPVILWLWEEFFG